MNYGENKNKVVVVVGFLWRVWTCSLPVLLMSYLRKKLFYCPNCCRQAGSELRVGQPMILRCARGHTWNLPLSTKERQTDRDRERQRQRQTGRETERRTETETERDRERKREKVYRHTGDVLLLLLVLVLS